MIEDRGPPEDLPLEDAEFRLGVRARDARAWERLHALFSAVLLRQASWLLPSRIDAEDVIAEVWFRALRNIRRYDPARSPLPWLARICTNVCLNLRRGPRSRPSAALDINPVAAPTRSSEESDGRREACRVALRSLPNREREVVTLRYLFSLPTKEIAELLDTTISAVDQAVVRGVERLKREPSVAHLAEWAEAGSIDGMERVTT